MHHFKIDWIDALTVGEPSDRHGKTTTGAVEGEVVAKVKTTHARSWISGLKCFATLSTPKALNETSQILQQSFDTDIYDMKVTQTPQQPDMHSKGRR